MGIIFKFKYGNSHVPNCNKTFKPSEVIFFL